RVPVAQLDEARSRLRRLDLLLELPRGVRVDGALGIGSELDDADGAVGPEIHAWRHGHEHCSRASREQQEQRDLGVPAHLRSSRLMVQRGPPYTKLPMRERA